MIISVSSGHQESVVLAYADGQPLQDNGQTLIVQNSPSLNIHCLVDDKDGKLSKRLGEALSNLRASLSQSRRAVGFDVEDRLVLSLPGVTTTWDQKVGEKCVHGAGWPVAQPPNFCVIDDTYAGLIAGAIKSTFGICAFAGTGASVYMGTPDGLSRSYNPGKPFKLDGFGPMLGDHGSGFRLAMSTLERICRDLDVPPAGDQPESWRILFDDLTKQIQQDYQRELKEKTVFQNWFDSLMANQTPDWRFQIAELAKVITRAAQRGDPYAQARVSDAAKSMVETLRSALSLEFFEDMHSAPIYCQGGMFRHSEYYLEQVEYWLNEDDKFNEVVLAKYRPCVGALLVAASPNWTVPNSGTIDAIERAIAAVPLHDRNTLFNKP